MELILASQSPRRRELLERMGAGPFRIVPPEIDERQDKELSPAQQVQSLSLCKALAVQEREGTQCLIIAADTVVSLDGLVLGKPADSNDARRMLSMLSGRRHQVYTGLTVLCGGERAIHCEETDVYFRELDQDEIEAYVATGEPMDKAGAYGIQGAGALFIERISGDYYNVMGLPVCRLGQLLKRFGISCLRQQQGG